MKSAAQPILWDVAWRNSAISERFQSATTHSPGTWQAKCIRSVTSLRLCGSRSQRPTADEEFKHIGSGDIRMSNLRAKILPNSISAPLNGLESTRLIVNVPDTRHATARIKHAGISQGLK
jgi:hypothetical protein